MGQRGISRNTRHDLSEESAGFHLFYFRHTFIGRVLGEFQAWYNRVVDPQKPEFLKGLFWDINFGKFNPKKYPRYTIERILEYGREDAIRWMFKNYPEDEIKDALKRSRVLTGRSANFWRLALDMPRDDVLCLTKSFQEKHRLFWPY